jgi:hypothetical protein
VEDLRLDRGARVVSAERVYDSDILTLFHTTGDFRNRSRWQVGVNRVEEVAHMLPRVGMRCRYVYDDGTTTTFTSSYYSYGEERIEFVETDESTGNATRYLLEQLQPGRTRLTVEIYVMKGRAAEILFRVTRKAKVERQLLESMTRLDSVVAEVREEEAALTGGETMASPPD